MYTLEIAGRPVAVVDVPTRDEAEAWLNDEAFQEDLMVLEHEGQPLWDGQAELRLRAATDEERSVFEDSMGDNDPGDDDDGEAFVVFLVDVTDPADDLSDRDD
ncbi:hypothetical protein [Geminicoccus harenae]|uniref:hypothetical protein n=1 Tax=Geminicoccus harenae TaxID=2498453 RepID=UPI00168A7433|nr:hypothetical protein [Geminicoccus harenae]